MYSRVAWVLVSSEIQVQSQIIFGPDYLPDYLSFSYFLLPLFAQYILVFCMIFIRNTSQSLRQAP